jgi:putative SOS response-associated peptidase YedK
MIRIEPGRAAIVGGMCGRAILVSSVEDIAEMFAIPAFSPDLARPPRFNVAPGQDVLVLRDAPSSTHDGGRELALLRWGLVPWWSKDTKIAGKCIQARAETLAKAPAFRDAFKSRRCLVVVDGFYEWSGTGKNRQPHYVHLAGAGPFAIAAVWDSWKSPEGTPLETCAVVTTAARGPVAQLHDRMPLVLGPDARERWLTASPEDARHVVSEGEAERFLVVPVSTWVNDVKHDDPRCLEARAQPPAPRQTAFRFG